MQRSLIGLLILFAVTTSFGQKLKYKDIYADLEVENYEKALPQLVEYLKLYPDDGSANLYMGVIAQEVEKDCEKAKTYFEKGLSVIDQKILDKNEKYYGLWNRRNLRTGKYGVNIDTIRIDVDERMEGCDG